VQTGLELGPIARPRAAWALVVSISIPAPGAGSPVHRRGWSVGKDRLRDQGGGRQKPEVMG
jgi:hypothetical protein